MKQDDVTYAIEAKKFIEDTFDSTLLWAKDTLLQEGTVSPMCMLLGYDNDKEEFFSAIIAAAELFRDNEGKNMFAQIMKGLIQKLQRDGKKVEAFILVSEVWFREFTKEQEKEYTPGSLQHDRQAQEAIMVKLETPLVGTKMLRQLFVRDSQNKISFTGDPEVTSGIEIAGRFSNFFSRQPQTN